MGDGNFKSPFRFWQLNLHIFGTIIFLYVALSQSLDHRLFIYKENERNVAIELTIPEFDVPVLRISRSSDNKVGTLIFVNQGVNVTLMKTYAGAVTTTTDKSQRKVSMTFAVMKLAYAATYKCYEATSENIVKDCGFKLIVLAKPSKPTIGLSESSSVLVGGTAVLVCQFVSNTQPYGHGLKPSVSWQDSDGNEITSPRLSLSQNGSLILSDISRNDLGMSFTCHAADDPGPSHVKVFSDYSSSFEIRPEYPPSDSDFNMEPAFDNNTNVQKSENDKLKYECRVDCQPACDVSWKKKPYGASNFSSIIRSKDRKVLSLKAVSRKDQGSFICQAFNKHGTNRKGFNLEVLYILTPEVIVSKTGAFRKSVLEADKEEVDLTCFVDSNPRPTVTWRNPSNWLINQSHFSGPEVQLANKTQLIHRYTSNVTLRDLTCEQGGRYRCSAQNDLHISTDGGIDIKVRCQPSAVVYGQYPGIDHSLILQEEYVWELGRSLKGSFVIRGLPTPTVKKVVSSIHGLTREEVDPRDVSITSQHPYNNKSYLTLFSFHIQRELTMADRGRVFRLLMENGDFQSQFQFTVQPRGPPLPVSQLNTTHVSHNAFTLSWIPGFNGGESQSFLVHIKEDASQRVRLVTVKNQDDDGDGKVKVRVKSLSGGTTYEVTVMSLNQRGNASVAIFVSTPASPAASANAGAIAGAVIAILVVVIICLVLFYLLVYRKRWGKGTDGEIRVPMLGHLFRGKKTDSNGNVGTDQPRPKPRSIFTGTSKTPKPKEKDYSNVPTESIDPTDYCNVDVIHPNQPVIDDVIHPYQPVTEADSPVGKTGEGRVVTDEGLTYVTVDFGGIPPPKPRRVDSLKDSNTLPKGSGSDGSDDGCAYSSIDFEKTRVKEEEMKRLEEEEAERKRQEEEEKMRGEGEEDYYENMSSLGTTV